MINIILILSVDISMGCCLRFSSWQRSWRCSLESLLEAES